MVGLPVGLRLVIDNAIANAVKHGGATEVRLAVHQLRRRGSTSPSTTTAAACPRRNGPRCSSGSPAGRRHRVRVRDSAWRWSLSRPNCTAAQQLWVPARWAGRSWCCSWPDGPGESKVRRLGLEILQPHLPAGDQAVPVVADGHQPQLLAAAAVDRFGYPVRGALGDGPQEIGVVVDPDDIAAAVCSTARRRPTRWPSTRPSSTRRRRARCPSAAAGWA